MTCKACGAAEGEPCLFCGHLFCGLHRADLDGAGACAPCLAAERARRAGAAAAGRAAQAGPPSAGATPLAERAAACAAPVSPPQAPSSEPPEPTPRPRRPLRWGLLAALAAGLYLAWLAGWLAAERGWPAWSQAALPALGAALAGMGVWTIVKSR